MKSSHETNLKSNLKFQNELHILLIGYLNYATSLENLQKSTSTNISPKKVLLNGLKISTKYLGEDSLITQKFMSYLKKISNLNEKPTSNRNLFQEPNSQINNYFTSKNEGKPIEKNNFFLKNTYHSKGFKLTSNSSKSKHNFQKSTAANFFRHAPEDNGVFDNTEYQNQTDRKHFRIRVKEIEHAISDLKKIKEDYQRERILIETEKNYFLSNPNNNFDQNYHQKPYINNTPISFMQQCRLSNNKKENSYGNVYASPAPIHYLQGSQNQNEPENELKQYIAVLLEENQILKQTKYEDQLELNNLKEYLVQKNELDKKNTKNENTLPYFNNNSEQKIYYPNSSPISNISGLFGNKFGNFYRNEANGIENNNDSHSNNKTKSPYLQAEEKSKSSGKYSTKASRNFKLNLEKVLKLDDNNEEDEVLERKAVRYKEEKTVGSKNILKTNELKNNETVSSQNLKKPNSKLLRATASIDLRGTGSNEKLNTSKSSISSQSKIISSQSKNDSFNSKEMFEFFGISFVEKLLQNFSNIIMNTEKNEVFRQNFQNGNKRFLKEIKISSEKEMLLMRINFYKSEYEDKSKLIFNYSLNFGSFLELIKTFDLRDVYSGFYPLKTLKTSEDFIRFCVLPFVSVKKFLNLLF